MKYFALLTAIFLTVNIFAQEENTKKDIDFSVGGSFVSSYLWRGIKLANASIQPEMELSAWDFKLGAWGSVDLIGSFKEADLYANYTFSGLTVGVLDCYIPSSENNENWFDFSKKTTEHLLEAELHYTFKPFPLTIGWNTMFFGPDKVLNEKTEKEEQVFSSYIEAAYEFEIKETTLSLEIGATPWRSSGLVYGEEITKFAVLDVSIMASKEIKITDNYAMPAFARFSVSPEFKDVHFVFGIKF